jgi:hypothetical protein
METVTEESAMFLALPIGLNVLGRFRRRQTPSIGQRLSADPRSVRLPTTAIRTSQAVATLELQSGFTDAIELPFFRTSNF